MPISPEQARYAVNLLNRDRTDSAVPTCKIGKPCHGRCIPHDHECGAPEGLQSMINRKLGEAESAVRGAKTRIQAGANAAVTGINNKLSAVKGVDVSNVNRRLGEAQSAAVAGINNKLGAVKGNVTPEGRKAAVTEINKRLGKAQNPGRAYVRGMQS